MVGIVRAQRISYCVEKLHLQVVLDHPRVHGALRVVTLLARHHRGDLNIAFHAYVGVCHAVVHSPLERIERRSHGDPSPYDELAINVSQPFELNQRRHVEQVRIARDVGYVPLDGKRGGLGHSLDRAVVPHAEEDAATLPVGERADSLKCVLARLKPATLELDTHAFACLDVSVKRVAHRCSVLFCTFILKLSRIDVA